MTEDELDQGSRSTLVGLLPAVGYVPHSRFAKCWRKSAETQRRKPNRRYGSASPASLREKMHGTDQDQSPPVTRLN